MEKQITHPKPTELILEYLFTVPHYAKLAGLTEKGARHRVNHNLVDHVRIDGKPFVYLKDGPQSITKK